MRKHDLKAFVNSGEKILWTGKPSRKNFVLESIFNNMFPVAVLWLIVEAYFISGTATFLKGNAIFVLSLILLMPVWIYLYGLIRSILKFHNTQYVITDQNVYVSGGILAFNYKTKSFAEINQITIHQGLIDGLLGTGDVIMSYSGTRFDDDRFDRNIRIEDISNYLEIYNMIKNRQKEVFSDIMYPNKYR